MTTWILIYWLMSGPWHNSPITTGSVEFNDLSACHAAFMAIKESKSINDTFDNFWGVCVPKSSVQP